MTTSDRRSAGPSSGDGEQPADRQTSPSPGEEATAVPEPASEDTRNGHGAGEATPASGAPPPRKPRFSIRTFQSLADPNYRWYFVSMFGWFAAMNMQMFARGYMVFEITGSYAALGIVSLAQAVPGLIFSFTGGVLADRVKSKKRLVQILTFANMLNVFAIAVLLILGELEVWHLYVNAAIQGGLMSNMMPARQVLTSEVVGLERLMNALALNQAGMNFNRLMMPALGGAILSIVGTGTGLDGAEYVYLFMTAMLGLAAFALIPVQVADRDVSMRPRATPGAVFSDLVEGLRYMRHDPTVRMLLLLNFVLVVGAMPYQQLLPGFTREVLGTDAGGLGFLMSIQGVGALIGALVIASMPSKNRGMLLLISSGILGVTLLLFSWSTWFWVSAGILVALGVGQSGRMSLSQVLVQSYTESEYRGRVMSVFMMEMSLMQLAVFVVGVVANIVGPQWAFGGTAVLTIGVVLYGFLFLPTLRRLQ